MDGTAFEPYGLLLQRFVTDRPLDRSRMYWRPEPAHHGAARRPEVDRLDAGGLRVAPGTVLSFDTYFNSFFESHWRRHTSLETLLIRLTIEGSGTLRVFRRAVGRKVLLREQAIETGRTTIRLPGEAVTFRQYGTLCVELEADTSELVFVAGGWWSEAQPVATTGLAAVFCTFNREADMARLLETLAGDAEVAARLVRLIVVNQGAPGLAANPRLRSAGQRLGTKLTVVEQANFGGAGGFGRGILAALDDTAASHAVLLDDDIMVEPDSLLRMAAFFALCLRDIVVGGAMLDLVQPNLLYEAGAIVNDRHWEFRPQHCGLNIEDPGCLEGLAMPRAVHYNGWWCCGFPLSVVEEHGMPLPCFIRGDDVEFGLRLHMRGIPTVGMPGVAVWHEPFYLKLGGWQHFYETRNLLVVATLHLEPSRLGTVRRIGRQFATNLLTFRYYSAALILDAIEEYLKGPDAMAANPADRHARLAAVRAAYPARTTSRETVIEPQELRRRPRTPSGHILLLAWLTVRNALVPTRTCTAKRLDFAALDWMGMRDVEHIAVESGWDEALPTFRRSRESHRRLLRRAMSVLPRLYREMPAAAAAWRQGASMLTSETFWRSYLSVAETAPAPAESRVSSLV